MSAGRIPYSAIDWRSVHDYKSRFPEHRAEFQKLLDDMHEYEGVLNDFYGIKKPIPPRPDLVMRISAIINQPSESANGDSEQSGE